LAVLVNEFEHIDRILLASIPSSMIQISIEKNARARASPAFGNSHTKK